MDYDIRDMLTNSEVHDISDLSDHCAIDFSIKKISMFRILLPVFQTTSVTWEHSLRILLSISIVQKHS